MIAVNILTILLATGVTVAAVVFAFRRFNGGWPAIAVLGVALSVGLVSARRQYEGEEARTRLQSVNPRLESETAPEGQSVTVVGVVEWNVVRGTVAASISGLATLGLALLLSKRKQVPDDTP